MKFNTLLTFLLGVILVTRVPRGKKIMQNQNHYINLTGTTVVTITGETITNPGFEPNNQKQYEGSGKVQLKVSLIDEPKQYRITKQEVGSNVVFEVLAGIKKRETALMAYYSIVNRLTETGNYDYIEEGTTNGLGRFIVFQFKEDTKLWEMKI